MRFFFFFSSKMGPDNQVKIIYWISFSKTSGPHLRTHAAPSDIPRVLTRLSPHVSPSVKGNELHSSVIVVRKSK